jgi:phosphoenolpyruvate carboxykinase (ATP)
MAMDKQIMTKVSKDIESYGVKNVEEIYYNLSYDELYDHETNPDLEGFDKGFVTDLGAVAVDTGIFYRTFSKRQIYCLR